MIFPVMSCSEMCLKFLAVHNFNCDTGVDFLAQLRFRLQICDKARARPTGGDDLSHHINGQLWKRHRITDPDPLPQLLKSLMGLTNASQLNTSVYSTVLISKPLFGN